MSSEPAVRHCKGAPGQVLDAPDRAAALGGLLVSLLEFFVCA